jgi:hypothetical protein
MPGTVEWKGGWIEENDNEETKEDEAGWLAGLIGGYGSGASKPWRTIGRRPAVGHCVKMGTLYYTPPKYFVVPHIESTTAF